MDKNYSIDLNEKRCTSFMNNKLVQYCFCVVCCFSERIINQVSNMGCNRDDIFLHFAKSVSELK